MFETNFYEHIKYLGAQKKLGGNCSVWGVTAPFGG